MAPGAETPTGLFYVQSKFTPTAPILGAYAFETSAYSKPSDWPGGGVVGVHGTPWPAPASRASRLTRLRADAQLGHPLAADAHADRNAGQDRPLSVG
jgi:hypothetical protein